MRYACIYFLITLLLTLACKHVTGQMSIASDTNVIASDTIDIARRFTIREPVFDSLVFKFVYTMEKRLALKSINDNITLFRIFNTFDWLPGFPNKSIYLRFKYLFSHVYSAPVLHKLSPLMVSGDYGVYLFVNKSRFDLSKFEFTQKAYYNVIFKNFIRIDTGNITRQLAISERDFSSEIDRFLSIMAKSDTIKAINDYIILVRLDNTIMFGTEYQKMNPKYFDKDIYRRFDELFYRKYFQRMVVELHAVKRKGGEGFYSFYYGVGIGRSSFFVDERDYYHIIFK